MSRRSRRAAADQPKPQLRWEAALFAFATNMLLVTVLTGFVQTMSLPVEFEALATVGGPLLAGVLTAFYARHRGGTHAFLGGMLSILPLTFFIFQGNWQPALYAGAFCTMGGALTEVVQRRFQRPDNS